MSYLSHLDVHTRTVRTSIIGKVMRPLNCEHCRWPMPGLGYHSIRKGIAKTQGDHNHKFRRKKWRSTTKVPFRNTKGEIAGLVCMSRDITEEKELRDNLKKVLEILRSDLTRLSGEENKSDPLFQSEPT